MIPSIEKVIHSIDEFRKEHGNPFWNVSYDTGLFLRDLAKAHNATQILEIGTSIGYSGLFFADALSSTGGHLTTVESNKDRFAEATQRFTAAKCTEHITQVFGHAPEIFPEIAGRFDFVFFDATKFEYASYIEAIEEKLLPNALVVADNIDSHEQYLQSYLDLINQSDHFQSIRLPIGTGLLVSQYTKK